MTIKKIVGRIEDDGTRRVIEPFECGSAVNGPGFDAGCVRVESVKAKPNYGYNPLRWLLRRPKFYEVTATFSVQPEAQS